MPNYIKLEQGLTWKGSEYGAALSEPAEGAGSAPRPSRSSSEKSEVARPTAPASLLALPVLSAACSTSAWNQLEGPSRQSCLGSPRRRMNLYLQVGMSGEAVTLSMVGLRSQDLSKGARCNDTNDNIIWLGLHTLTPLGSAAAAELCRREFSASSSFTKGKSLLDGAFTRSSNAAYITS